MKGPKSSGMRAGRIGGRNLLGRCGLANIIPRPTSYPELVVFTAIPNHIADDSQVYPGNPYQTLTLN